MKIHSLREDICSIARKKRGLKGCFLSIKIEPLPQAGKVKKYFLKNFSNKKSKVFDKHCFFIIIDALVKTYKE